jgi:hypothetical protein
MSFDLANDNYTVFLDDGSGGVTAGDGKQEGTEPTIKTVSLPNNVSWQAVTFAGNLYLRYTSLGRPIDMGSAQVVNAEPAYRGVTVNFTGNVDIQTSTDGVTWTSVN